MTEGALKGSWAEFSSFWALKFVTWILGNLATLDSFLFRFFDALFSTMVSLVLGLVLLLVEIFRVGLASEEGFSVGLFWPLDFDNSSSNCLATSTLNLNRPNLAMVTSFCLDGCS